MEAWGVAGDFVAEAVGFGAVEVLISALEVPPQEDQCTGMDRSRHHPRPTERHELVGDLEAAAVRPEGRPWMTDRALDEAAVEGLHAEHEEAEEI